MFYLLCVVCLIVVGYEARHSGVVSKLHYSVGGVFIIYLKHKRAKTSHWNACLVEQLTFKQC